MPLSDEWRGFSNGGDAALIAETVSSRIWKTRREDGSTAVVKELKPSGDVEDELRGAYFLAWRDGEGAVKLLGRDGLNMLIEYAGEEHLADVVERQGDPAATEIAAGVIARLHAPSSRPAPAGLQPLRARFASLFARADEDGKDGRRSPYVGAARLAGRILGDQRGVRPLHGDLHHDNILLSARGWLAIDPKGVLGDPAFDAANMFFNPLQRDDLCRDAGRIAGMAAIFARGMAIDPRRLLDFAVAYGCLSAAWHAEDGHGADEARTLLVAEAIRAVRVSF